MVSQGGSRIALQPPSLAASGVDVPLLRLFSQETFQSRHSDT